MPRTRLALLASLLVIAAILCTLLPGCKSDSDSSTGPGGTITVAGKVIGVGLQPLANSPVVIKGLPPTTTNASGLFSISGVTVPYDLTVAVSASKLGITYRGLTRTDPTVINFLSSGPTTNSAAISGTISGGAGYPEPATRTSSVVLSSAEVSATTSPNSATGAYSMTANWDGAATITTTLHALQWDKSAAGMPAAYNGYASKTGVTVTAGGTFASQNIALTAVSAQTISGTVTVPAALGLASKTMSLQFAPKGAMPLGTESGAATAFTYVVPMITGTTLSVSALASGAAGTSSATDAGVAPGTNGIAITLLEPSALSLPVNAATGVTTSTPFTWTPVSGSIYILLLNGPAGQPDYLVVTSTTTTTIPDLTDLGLGLPAGQSYTWNVITFGPFTSLDAASGQTGFILQNADFNQTTSASRSFMTAP
jgi:hypothetical protein